MLATQRCECAPCCADQNTWTAEICAQASFRSTAAAPSPTAAGSSPWNWPPGTESLLKICGSLCRPAWGRARSLRHHPDEVLRFLEARNPCAHAFLVDGAVETLQRVSVRTTGSTPADAPAPNCNPQPAPASRMILLCFGAGGPSAGATPLASAPFATAASFALPLPSSLEIANLPTGCCLAMVN